MKAQVLVSLVLAFSSVAAFAAPRFVSCISDDQMVAVALAVQSQDSEMIDLAIKSNNSNRPAEAKFPCRENLSAEKATYTLLDSEFELLAIDIATGKGKLSKAQFGGPNPFIDVTCQ